MWEIYTHDNGNADPILTIYDSRGNEIAHDDDGGDGYNARIVIQLEGQTTYTISADFWGSDYGNGYLLTVRPSEAASSSSIPAGGGTVQVRGETEFEFTPNQSGLWEIFTHDNGGDDPVMEILDSDGDYIDFDDDSGDGYNARIVTRLQSGTTYTIRVWFYMSDTGVCSLTARSSSAPTATDSIGGDGGVVQVVGNTTFSFTPNASGTWEFRTSDSGNTDPYLELISSSGDILAQDDDGAVYGDDADYNAMIVYHLEAGITYLLAAKTYFEGGGNYTLTTTYHGNAEPSGTLPNIGGTVRVSGETDFTFVPNQSGLWEFRTINNVDSDPTLEIYRGSPSGNPLASDDDGGDGLNSLIVLQLEGGTTYTIRAGFYWGSGDCHLVVIRR